MHLYNAWLPPAVAEESKREKESFHNAVKSVKDSWRSDDPDSVFSTLKWISVIDLFIKAKSEVVLQDVVQLFEFGLHIFSASQNKLYPQVRWGGLLLKLLTKFGKQLSFKIQWRPFYHCLLTTHFSRNTGPEGWRLRQRHFEILTSLVRRCRKFFPAGSAFEIWSEFRPLLENPWHNSSFEGSGFVRLFLPTNLDNQDFFSDDWIRQCIDHWNSIPNCPFWDSQWASVIARCIKNFKFMDWEEFLPVLFTRYLNLFEVPVANSNASFPFSVEVPRYTKFLFSNKSVTPAKAIAKSIVYLLKPGSSAQVYFEKLVNLLEQFYHPSNGGRWTYSLERFLRYLIITFEKRLKHEQLNNDDGKCAKQFLGKAERISFIEVVLKLINRGQYSKSESLAETVAAATSILSYVEPSLVLSFVASRFQMALETMTATHQLTTAVMSVAYSGRVLYLTSFMSSFQEGDPRTTNDFIDLLVISLSNALLGMDANDPPKTLATMQLIGSIFSNICELNENEGERSSLPGFSFSEWLNEFLCRLFSMLQHLEPSSVLNEGIQSSVTSGTFLVEDGPHYFCMLEVLLGKLSKPLYSQALKKVSKFVTTNILPGAVYEVGLLCCACVHSNPEAAALHLIEPLLNLILTSLRELPVTGYGGKGSLDNLISKKSRMTISPALETAIDYQLKILSVAVSYGGHVVLQYRDQFKEAILSAFEAPSWKINGAGDHVLRSLLGCLLFYYPMDQYKCISCHPDAALVEKWIGTKCCLNNGAILYPKWHSPSEDELQFANELFNLHFCSALEDLLRMCQTKACSDPGNVKEHMKVTLLRVDSSLQGVMSCLPDFCPSFTNGQRMEDVGHNPFFIAGATGGTIGSSEMREKAAEIMHLACKYMLEERSDDSILLILVIRIIDALGNFGSLEYDEWSNHRQAWRLESSAIIEPPINFIDQSHSQGKKRPRWALIDKAYMHSTWRSSQSSYHLYRTTRDISPPEVVTLLMHDLVTLSLHSYETVRALAGKSLLKMLKRWPCMISKCILSFTENLYNPDSSEHTVLGSCAILATQTIIKHLTVDPKAFSSFLLGVLVSSHHESLKCQKAINELFVKYNIHFAGVSKSIFRTSEGTQFTDLVSQIGLMSIDTNGLHWRYNLMANRILLLLIMVSRSEPDSSSKVLSETAGHFLKNLKSQLPQTRILAISALNTLLIDSPHKISTQAPDVSIVDIKGETKSSFQSTLSQIYEEDGFFHETLNSLSHVHVITDSESTSSRGNHGATSFQSLADKSITRFYFDFSSSWPRTPSWISALGGDTFYSNFARIFKRLVQECGVPVLLSLRSSLEEFSNAKERSKQCVAAEVLAGVMHSDVNGLFGEWDSWISIQLQNIIQAPMVESLHEWAACIRYAVTGKGKYGTKVPLLRQKILDCLVTPLPQMVATNVVAKRYAFLSAALVEIHPPRMPLVEIQIHDTLLKELLDNMRHTSAQVREAIGVNLTVLCSNIRLYESFVHDCSGSELMHMDDVPGGRWDQILTERACELAQNIQKTGYSENLDSQSDKMLESVILTDEIQEDVKWMETMFHFIISSLKSGRSQVLLDIIVDLLYPVISLKETSNKDLSTFAKAAFELLKWRIFPEPHLQKAVSVILSLSNDLNWRTRFSTLTYLRTFVHRHTFILARAEKQKIWRIMEKLLVDNQVEVREHAAAVLAGLMKGGDEDSSRDFRERAFTEALSIKKSRTRSRLSEAIASIHGAVLALAASVLSVPYDMPRWLPDHVTLLAHFIGEPSPVRSTVMKAVAEFRRTHADTWNVQKDLFSEEQLEVLADTSSSASYFA